MVDSIPQSKYIGWFSQSPWRLFTVGMALALAMVVVLMLLMQAPIDEVAKLAPGLVVTSLLSLGIGYALYRRGWTRSPSLNITLVMTYGWAALLTLFNVWVSLERMAVSRHDLILSVVLLLFAAIIATTFGIFVAASVTDCLRQVAHTAEQVAKGDLTARVTITGRDEVARVGEAFNEMAEQLQQTAQQREELDHLRRDLIAWTSHDLRTPLTSIRAMIEALHDGVVDNPETIRRYYRTLRADVIALNSLIDDLFELAQLDAGGMALEMSLLSLSDLISDTVESFRVLAQQRGIALNGQVSDDLDPVLLNAPKIGRVLSNLLSNALRYSPAEGQVQLKAQRIQEGVQVTIQDNGPGFNPQDLPRVFEQFYRGEPARSRSTGGAGLGLAIARGIIEAHNGRIWAENIEDGGAIVGFILPMY